MIRKTCPYCEDENPKSVEGYTERQVELMLMQHIISRHPEMVSINEEAVEL